MLTTGTFVDFKESRYGKKKRQINVTVDDERLKRIEAAITEMNVNYGFLNKTERVDFLFFMLEKYMFPNN